MRKTWSILIVAMMLCVGFSIVSVNVPAEDITGPFAVRNDGYPISTDVWDVELYTGVDAMFIGQGQPEIFVAQTFKPTANGELQYIGVFVSSVGGTGLFGWDFRTGLPDGSSLIGGYQYRSVTMMTGGTWNYLTVPTTPALTVGQTYSLVMTADASSTISLEYDGLNPYPDGASYESADDLSWGLLDGSGIVDFDVRTNMLVQLGGIKKIAWHESGGQAWGVTGNSEHVYAYSRDVGTWSTVFSAVAGDVFTDITYDEVSHMFYIVGYSGDWPIAFTWDMTNGFVDRGSPPTMGVFHAVAPCANFFDGSYSYAFLAVGETSLGGGYAAWWSPDKPGNWVEANSGLDNEECLLDVTWDWQFSDESYYAVGYDTANSYAVIYSWGAPGDSIAALFMQDNPDVGRLNAIEWCPDYQTNNCCLMAGNYYGGTTSNIYKWFGIGSSPLPLTKTSDDFHDISWFPDGSQAVIVGENSGSGAVYTHSAFSASIVSSTHLLPSGTGPLYGIACKGPSSPSSGIVTGSGGAIGFYPSALDQSTRLTANAVFPKLYWIGFNDTAYNNRLDQQVVPDTNYLFTLEANYSEGWTNCEIVIRAWHDIGLTGALGSAYPAETDANRNLAFNFTYNAFTGAYDIAYPAGDLEFADIAVTETEIMFPHPATDPENNRRLAVEIAFGPQARMADYGGAAPIGPLFDMNPLVALNNVGSWDFSVTVRDRVQTTAANTSYAEFGIQASSSVVVTGSPSGNAPPGTANNLMTTNSQITYSSNAPYFVNVSIPNLLRNGVGPDNILATAVSVQNIEPRANAGNSAIPAQTNFLGPNTPYYVWGLNLAPMPAVGNGTVSNADYISDYNAAANAANAYTELTWWVTVIAGTPEGIYWGVITISIEN